MVKHISRTLVVVAIMAFVAALTAQAAPPEGSAPEAKADKNVTVIMETSEGTITIELWPDKAPKTVENFLSYVDEKFYDDTIFHRVIPNFMIQGGGFTKDMAQKATHDPIVNEAKADVPNNRGTLAMARTNVVNSATCQFFINHKDNAFLNHRGETAQTFGYAVFGKVTAGMEVVDKIAKTPTGNSGMFQNVPKTPVIIKSIRRAKVEPKPEVETAPAE